jgi:hypothetical protein
MDDTDYSDAAAILVISVSEVKPRSVRVNITVPEDMLRKIDNVAKKKRYVSIILFGSCCPKRYYIRPKLPISLTSLSG